MDIKIAFLYGLINQLVYVNIPKKSEIKANCDMVCKVLKALYNLKQSLQLWYKKLSNFLLQKLGFSWINTNHSIFVSKAGLDGPIISIFVDDIKIIAPKRSGIILWVKAELTAAFLMVDMGPISFYLGLKLEQIWQKQTIKLSQLAYIDKMLNKFYLNKAHAVTTLIKKSAFLLHYIDREATTAEKKRYQGMTNSIMFRMIETRPDIAFATLVTAQFAKTPAINIPKQW